MDERNIRTMDDVAEWAHERYYRPWRSWWSRNWCAVAVAAWAIMAAVCVAAAVWMCVAE